MTLVAIHAEVDFWFLVMSRSSFAHILRMMSDRIESATGLDPWARRLRSKLSFVESAPIRGALEWLFIGPPTPSIAHGPAHRMLDGCVDTRPHP